MNETSTSAEPGNDELADALRAWTQYGEPWTRAAVELLIWQGWHRRSDFAERCISRHGAGPAEIRWTMAAAFAFDPPSPVPGGMLTVLMFALLLADGAAFSLAFSTDDLWPRLHGLGSVHKRKVINAVAVAIEYDPAAKPFDPEAWLAAPAGGPVAPEPPDTTSDPR